MAWQEECGSEQEAFQSLMAYGPSGAMFPDPTKFTATGFVRSGWPIVIRYRVPVGARPRLTIKPQYGRGRKVEIELPPSADGGPQSYTVVAQVPGSGGNILVADYKINARYPVAGGRDQIAPVTILGIGAGGRAASAVAMGELPFLRAEYSLRERVGLRLPFVLAAFAAPPAGSAPIAIDDVRFAPPIIQRPRDTSTVTLTYGYVLKNEWDRVAEDLWRSCKAVLRCNLSHPHHPYAPTSQGRQQWTWLVNRGTEAGLYQLVVRAWKTCGALADPNAYYQCGDAADWVIGSAGPISVAN